MALHLKPELLCFQFLCSVSIKLTYFLFSLNVNAYDWSNDIVLLLNRTKIRAPHWLLQRITYLDNCVIVFYTLFIPQLTAIQAKTMTRGQKQEEVRLEIIKLREQINAANNQLPGQGTVDLPALVQKEAELTRSLTQTYLLT